MSYDEREFINITLADTCYNIDYCGDCPLHFVDHICYSMKCSDDELEDSYNAMFGHSYTEDYKEGWYYW